MAYPPRLFVEGYWYHVYTRGQRREPLYFSPLDRIAYLSFLDEELTRRGGRIGSYCLMTNHVHLLIRMGNTPLGTIFRAVHMKYAKYFNRKREATGHVFQGRPGMKIVLDDSYLNQLVGYIHRNPVEAGMVEKASEFRWSSWNWFIGDQEVDLACGFPPPGFSGGNRDRAFMDVVEQELEIEGAENYWGSREEWEQMERRREGREGRKFKERREWKSKQQIAREVVEGSSVTMEELQGQTQDRTVTKYRREAMGRMHEEGYGSTEIGKYFNRTPGAVTHACKKRKEE